jgi:nucleoside 2-deoxyribosyltransferase
MSTSRSPSLDKRGEDVAGHHGPYSVYAAGGLFTQHELATNVFLKEAIARTSNGKYQLILPQSKEMRALDRPDAAANIRNIDLVLVFGADILLARFDGLELDAGTVVEFMMAKALGKPAVVLRCDFRGLLSDSLDAPYNLMVRNWPRTVEVYVPSLISYAKTFAEACRGLDVDDWFQATLDAELSSVQEGLDEMALKIIAALDAVLKMESPYPSVYQETLYRALRHMPGCGFEELLSDEAVCDLVKRLRRQGTL